MNNRIEFPEAHQEAQREAAPEYFFEEERRLEDYDFDAYDRDMELARLMDEDSDRMEREYDAYEAAQLQKLDEIMDGDWD